MLEYRNKRKKNDDMKENGESREQRESLLLCYGFTTLVVVHYNSIETVVKIEST